MTMLLISVMFSSSTELMLTVIQARDLERDHVTGSLDSYVRALLTPFTGSRSQTRVREHTASFCRWKTAIRISHNATVDMPYIFALTYADLESRRNTGSRVVLRPVYATHLAPTAWWYRFGSRTLADTQLIVEEPKNTSHLSVLALKIINGA